MIKPFFIAALPLLAGCTTIVGAALPLAPSQWTFVSIDGETPRSSKARLTIEGDRIGANVGCNGLGGDLKIEGDRLVTGGIISTMMYCEGLMEQERAVSALLGGSPRFIYKGNRLVLESAGHKAELQRLR